MRRIVLLALIVLAMPRVFAASEPVEAVYIIFDGSGSMWGQLPDGTHKITAARAVLTKFVGGDFGDKDLALRAYGYRRKGDCSDTELVVPFSPAEHAAPEMRSFVADVNPTGKTPISRSLRAALEDFGDRTGEIILISDGVETCDEDPCELVRAWNENSVAIKVHVVGLGLSDQERTAMQCISEAAGTEYHDANSAEELAVGLTRIHEVSRWQVLDIIAVNAVGESMRVVGSAARDGHDPTKVSSNGHNRVPPGTYSVTVGVKTRNGNLYRPVTHSVEVADTGATAQRFEVLEPPSVHAKFVQGGESVRGSNIAGYQNGVKVVGFRPQDRAYVDPGTYEFRAAPNADNELSVTESFAEGDHKEIVFELTHTVHASIKMVAAGSGQDFRTNYELWQNGEKKYSVHWGNGVRAIPGTYDLHLTLRLNPYVHEGLVLTAEGEQTFRIEVPVGHVTVIYENADGTRAEDERCFVERATGERYLRDGISRTGKPIALVPGTYRVNGWNHVGTFDTVDFDVAAGDEKTIVLRDKGD